MIIREPVVQATYYYLREAPGDSPGRRQDRHELFVADVYRIAQSVSGWLARPMPDLPPIPVWQTEPPRAARVLMETGMLEGPTKASAGLTAYSLRNMLLLRVMVSRPGEHEQSVWSMLDETLAGTLTTRSWLYTTRYWCALAPRPPEDLEQGRMQAIKTPFGVLCMGTGARSNLLVYPDARTESRANAFLRSLAVELDWYTVQAVYQQDLYENHASNAVRNQQHALEQVSRTAQIWTTPRERVRLQTLDPLQDELNALETAYSNMLADLQATQVAAQDVRALAAEYRQVLMQHGLWDASPSVWQARTADLEGIGARIQGDVQHIDTTLRRIEIMVSTLHTRTALLNSERERVLIYLVALLGFALLAVLVADTDPVQMLIRLVALVVVAGLVWVAWQRWLRARLP